MKSRPKTAFETMIARHAELCRQKRKRGGWFPNKSEEELEGLVYHLDELQRLREAAMKPESVQQVRLVAGFVCWLHIHPKTDTCRCQARTHTASGRWRSENHELFNAAVLEVLREAGYLTLVREEFEEDEGILVRDAAMRDALVNNFCRPNPTWVGRWTHAI